MKKRVLILEDLETSRKSLVQMVQNCGENLEVFDFEEVAGAYECAMNYDIDLFLVDIVLRPKDPNDFSGITFAKNIRENALYAAAEIVFITTLAGLEGELLRMVHCFDYIEKPLYAERVQKVVKAALYKVDGKVKKDEILFLRKERITYCVEAKKIVYVESRRKILYIHTTDDVIEIPHLTLKQMMQRVQSQTLLCPTKGIAVNVKYIEYVDSANRYVKMKGNDQLLEIGSRLKSTFMNNLYELEGVNVI